MMMTFRLQKGINMSHELYENWLLSEPPLTLEQKEELNTHLQSCPQCRKLAAGWKGALQQISAVSMAEPAPGFSQRWQNSLAERRRRKQKMTIRWLLLGLIFAAAVSLTSLVLFLTNTIALLDWWVKSAASLERLGTWINQAGLVLSSWFSGFPPIVLPAIFLMVVSTGFTVLVVLWVSVAKQLSFQGVTQQ
jgi:anti-sigma factor RsiW